MPLTIKIDVRNSIFTTKTKYHSVTSAKNTIMTSHVNDKNRERLDISTYLVYYGTDFLQRRNMLMPIDIAFNHCVLTVMLRECREHEFSRAYSVNMV